MRPGMQHAMSGAPKPTMDVRCLNLGPIHAELHAWTRVIGIHTNLRACVLGIFHIQCALA